MNRNSRGFTLIELLVVLTILAILTTVAVTSVDGIQDQTRYDATQRTLNDIRAGILGPNTVGVNGQLSAGGYLQDVGWLPLSTSDLAISPSITLPSTATRMPVRTYSNTWKTYFGWNGPYANQPLRTGGDTQLYDGYGRNFYFRNWPVAALPWVAPAYVDYDLTSTGADGLKDPPLDTGSVDGFNRDYPDSTQPLIPVNEAYVDLQGLQAKIKNEMGSSITISLPANCRLRIVVPRWNQTTGELSRPDTLEPALQYYLSHSDPERDAWPHYGAKKFSFSSSLDTNIDAPLMQFGDASSGPVSRPVPIGRRMIFIVDEATGLPAVADVVFTSNPSVHVFVPIAGEEISISSKLVPTAITFRVRN